MNPCKQMKKLLEDRASWLKVKHEETTLENEPEKWVCMLDYKDREVGEKLSEPTKMIGSVVFDRRSAVEGSDLPLAVKIIGKEPEEPTSRIAFPESCQLEQIHSYNHNVPMLHLHFKCKPLDEKQMRKFADAIVNVSRLSREYAGLKT